jgi:hypothetical protein
VTLVARSVVGFLVESAVWVAIVAVISLVASAPLWAPRRTASAAGRALLWAGGGAVLIASVVHRLDGPLGPAAAVGGRDLPLLWLAAGAVAGTLALAVHGRRRAAAP